MEGRGHCLLAKGRKPARLRGATIPRPRCWTFNKGCVVLGGDAEPIKRLKCKLWKVRLFQRRNTWLMTPSCRSRRAPTSRGCLKQPDPAAAWAEKTSKPSPLSADSRPVKLAAQVPPTQSRFLQDLPPAEVSLQQTAWRLAPVRMPG